MLAGMKTDLRNDPRVVEVLRQKGQQVISHEDGKAFAQKINAAAYVECSAKTSEGTSHSLANNHHHHMPMLLPRRQGSV